MIKREKGYSLGILVITIAVMLILTTTALVSFRSMSGDKAITNFMNDIQEVEEYVKEYYAENRVLPIKYNSTTKTPMEINNVEYLDIKSQISAHDSGKYYFIDLSKLERINLKDKNRGYIVNEKSLKVYVTEYTEYQGVYYYTVTDELRGYDKIYNENLNFEVLISGNPIKWTDKAKLILSIPNIENIDASKWQFKYYMPGPITAEEFRDKGKFFLYGESVEIGENGIVTFYIENVSSGDSGDVGHVKLVNVVIDKVDDVPPTIRISGDRTNDGEVIIIDNETGINPDALRYKIIGDDLNNPEEGIPLLTYGTYYADYIEEYNLLKSAYDDLAAEISDLRNMGAAEETLQPYYINLNSISDSILELNEDERYRSFNNGTIPYSDYESNIALYVVDYANNRVEDILGVSRKVLLNSSLVNYESKLLDNSTFSIVKQAQYTSGDKVNLRIRSQGATKMILTLDESVDPKNISNYDLPYESSNGEYEFSIASATGSKATIYAYYTAGEYDDDGKLIYKALSDSISIDREPPTDTAPEININNKMELTIDIKQEDLISGLSFAEYGYLEANVSENVNLYTWCKTVDEVEVALKPGEIYYIRTRVSDNAGNGPVISEYTKVQCPTKKIIATPNEPILENMQAITWKTNLEEVVIDANTLKDAAGITRVWYDYKLSEEDSESSESMWANAKSDDGSYWVWIPRYAYKIVYYTNSLKTEIKGYYQNSPYSNVIGYYLADGKTLSTEANVKTEYGEIDIVFLYNTEDYKYYDTETKLVKSLIDGGERIYSEYIVHPAFKSYAAGTSVNLQGNWYRELVGIWVSKFEASRTDATFLAQGTAADIMSVPNVKALTNVTINDAFRYASQMYAAMDSHLMKNSEWGAVAYLSYSAYGRNGNRVKPNLSSNMLTGGGTTSNGATYATTSEAIFNNRYSYKTDAGMNASTTGNIYGIYDMVGGTFEYVAAYVNNGQSVVSDNGSSLQSVANLYMSQTYNKGASDSSANNYTANANVKGDGIYEVSRSSTRAWGNTKIDYPASTKPFFTRGGAYSSDYSSIGIFEVDSKNGAMDEAVGFRAVLAP